MTSQQAQTLKFGSKVSFFQRPALVQRVQKNGVVVSYDGSGLKQGQYVTERVSARHLELRA